MAAPSGTKGFCRKHRDKPLINNRQAGRRRGRNNPRQNGGGNRGNGDSGNRIDNRARGNAAQLLEKYRNMARDAQLTGDRVNAEYYLQFADHYFRVLADSRTRQEEQQQRFQRNDEPIGDNFDGGDDGYDAVDDGDDGPSGYNDGPSNGRDYQNRRNDEPRRQEGRNGEGREQQPRRQEGRSEEGRERNRDRNRDQDGDRGNVRRERDDRDRDQQQGRRPRIANDDSGDDEGTISLAALPPSIGRGDNEPEGETAAPDAAETKPRRGRRPRSAEAAE